MFYYVAKFLFGKVLRSGGKKDGHTRLFTNAASLLIILPWLGGKKIFFGFLCKSDNLEQKKIFDRFWGRARARARMCARKNVFNKS